ncbi:unnamed protein product [Somion occarium]|uniref:Uncharacterized protein n=1 Tax=Somion occarium TaxID=3059160 RepID=A0ABP1DX08_9APHY
MSRGLAYIISIWLEAIVYGIFICLFCLSLYVNLSLKKSHTIHSKIMFVAGVVMFIMASLHFAINAYRMVKGYVVHTQDPGGAVAYLDNLKTWHHVLKDTLFGVQEVLGDLAAIYRCWVIWDRNVRVIIIPLLFFAITAGTGSTIVGMYPYTSPGTAIFDARFQPWILAFYASEMVQSTLVTSLMAFRIWHTDRAAAPFRVPSGPGLLPIARILIESAALLVVPEVILLALYAAESNGQFIVLETICSIVGITFTAITIRVTLQLSGTLDHLAPPHGQASIVVPQMFEHNLAPSPSDSSLPQYHISEKKTESCTTDLRFPRIRRPPRSKSW